MSRPLISPRRVEVLAEACAEMLAWLNGPGRSAPSSEFAARLLAYKALREAVSYLPRGPALLEQVGGIPEAPPAPSSPSERDAASFGIDELALMTDPVLTPQGWVVPAPLVKRVDEVRQRLRAEGKPHTDKDALIEMLVASARSQGRALWRVTQDLGAARTRLSRARTAITEGAIKVPPADSSE